MFNSDFPPHSTRYQREMRAGNGTFTQRNIGENLTKNTLTFLGQYSVAQAATCHPSASECLVRSRAKLCKFVGGSSGTGIGLFQRTSVVPGQYNDPST